MENLGKIVLRVGLALVFFWFSLNQLMSPEKWTGFIPEFLTSFASAKTLVIVNGTAELALAALLIIGLYTRIVALLLAIHLFGIAASVGLTPVGVRDFGLACGALALFLLGSDRFCIDNKLHKKADKKSSKNKEDNKDDDSEEDDDEDEEKS